jgi:hypothetical protein
MAVFEDNIASRDFFAIDCYTDHSGVLNAVVF